MARLRVLIIGGLTALSLAFSLGPGDGQIDRASVDIAGNQADQGSEAAQISRDGRYIVFRSSATNLISGDTNDWWDIFRKDLLTGEVLRVSTSSSGAEPNRSSAAPMMSADGRYVVFTSEASNLVPNDTNNFDDVFLKDLATGSLLRASTSTAGVQGNGTSYEPQISADGRYVAFTSFAYNLVGGDGNFSQDCYRKDLVTGETVRINVSSSGTESNRGAALPSISEDGRYVAFASTASNLVAGDTNNRDDVFRKDLQTGAIIRVSTSSSGQQGNAESAWLSMSGDGMKIAFTSYATNLVQGDTNASGDIFLKDVPTGVTTRVSVGSSGEQGDGHSEFPALSSDGLALTFTSYSTNFLSGDLNASRDVFRKHLFTGELQLVSQSNEGVLGPFESARPAISGDGTIVAFDSESNSLVPNDTNLHRDVFISRFGNAQFPHVVSLAFRPQLQPKLRGLWVTATLSKRPASRTSMAVDTPQAWVVPPAQIWVKSRVVPFFVRLTRAPAPGEKVTIRTTINGISYTASYKFPRR